MARTTVSPPTSNAALEPNLWTPDQESALLRSLVRYKPVGLHKHFRMIAIREYLLSQGVTTASNPHTSVPGIWVKLESLYDLAKLDEREDAAIFPGDDKNGDGDDESTGAEYWRDFELPEDDFGGLMWDRRLKGEGEGSSPAIGSSPHEVADSVEGAGADGVRSSPVSVSAPGSIRGARRGARRGGRVSKLQNEATANSSRRTSKANSVVEQDEDVEMEDDEDDEQSEDEESGDENETEEEKRPAKKGKAATNVRGRGKRGRKK